MKLADAVRAAYNRKWSTANNFTVQIDLKGSRIAAVGQFQEDINLSIISIKTPDITNAGIEAFIANEWRIHNGRDNLYSYNITFRDYDQMFLYQKFQRMYAITKEYYFNEVFFDTILYKDADWSGEGQREIIRLEDSIISSVSNLDFNNTADSSVAEFSVEFKCVNPLF